MKKLFSFLLIIMLSFFLYCCKQKNLKSIADEINLKNHVWGNVTNDLETNLEDIKKNHNVNYEIKFSDDKVARLENNIIKITRQDETKILSIIITISFGNNKETREYKVFVLKKTNGNTDVIDIPIIPINPLNPDPEPDPEPDPDPIIPNPIKNDFPVINAVNATKGSEVTVIGFITSFHVNYGVALQDSSGAITIKSSKDDTVKFDDSIKPLIGKYVKVTGTRDEYKGLKQINKITKIEEITEIKEEYPKPIDITKIDFNKNKDKLESKLISIKGAKVLSNEKDSKYKNIKIQLEFFGKTIEFRFDSRTNKEKWDSILSTLEVGKLYNFNNLNFTIYEHAQLCVSEKLEIKPYINETGKINVFFDLVGGSIHGGVKPQIIDINTTAKNPGSPTKDKYKFIGWSITGLSTELFNFDTKLKEDTTLKAVYKYLGGSNDFNDCNGYYTQVKGLSGTDLKNKLHTIIDKPATSYDTALKALKEADISTARPGYLYLMYTGDNKYNYKPSSGGWNREHVVPNSKLKEEGIPKGEAHNLRACDIKVNSSRSNYPFVEGNGQNKANGSTYYPGDEHVGDVARICLYMHIRYNFPLKKVGNLQLFLKWHKQDPVNEFEIRRNEILFKYQNNRNPFIDNPQFADLIFGEPQSTSIKNFYIQSITLRNLLFLEKKNLYYKNHEFIFWG